MLDLIRKKQKTFIVKFVFWAIIAAFIGTIFLVWGKGREQEERLSVAARVNDTEISFDEFRTTYSNLYNLYRSLYADAFTPEMEKQLQLTRQAINMLVDQALLVQKAEDFNINIGKDEVVASIAAVDAFQVDGSFNKDRYIEVLNYQRITPKVFEQMQRRQMLVNRVRSYLFSQVEVTDADVVEAFRRINEKANLAYIKFAPQDFLSKAKVEPEAVKRYYNDNKEHYRVPEQVGLEYAEISAASVRDQVKPSEEELKRYYERHLDQFAIEEKVRASHVLIKVVETDEPQLIQEKRERAEALRDRVENEDFSKLVQQYSEDKESSVNGGDLGYFSRNTFDQSFEDAAFALQPGEVSGIVRSSKGYHIIKVTDHIEPGYKPLDQVRSQVVAGFTQDESIRLAYEKAIDAYNMNRKQGGIVGAAQQLGLPVLKTGLFSRGQSIEGIGDVADLADKAFSAGEGEMIKPVRVRESVFIAQVATKKPSYIPELEQVHAEVEKSVRLQAATELARTEASAALQGAKQGGALADYAPTSTSVKETGLFARNLGGIVPGIGVQKQLADEAFTLSIKEPYPADVYHQGNSFYVVKLKQLQPADPEKLTQEESDALEAEVRQRKQNDALQAMLDEMRQDAAITIAPSILNAMKEE